MTAAVIQADRDAAADWFTLTNSLGIDHTGSAFEKALRDGSYDGDRHPLVQAFARHRIASQAELLSAAIYAVQQLADGDDPELDDDGEEIDPFERLRAAIANAEGRS